MLICAHKNGCLLCENVLFFSIEHKNLEMMKYAIENNCPENEAIYMNVLCAFYNEIINKG